MHRGLNYLLGVLIVAAISGCSGSVPTSPSSGPSSGPSLLPASIEISASTLSGSTLRRADCSDEWGDIYSCFKGLQLTFSVRSNQNSELPSFYAEFVTSAGKVCGNSWAETRPAALVAGVVATFRTP